MDILNRVQGVKTACYKPKDVVMHEISVFYEDQRKRVDSPEKWPHSAQGMIEIKDKTGQICRTGSGTLVGSKFVLTAAHNVYFSKGKVLNEHEVRFTPAADGKRAPFGSFKVISCYYPEEYCTNNSEDYEDYALLVLEQDIHEKIGYFGFDARFVDDHETMIKETEFEIYGYPTEKSSEQWGMKGKLDKADHKKLYYKQIATSKGQSGSAIYYEEKGNCWIVGVHQGSDQSQNVGVRLSMQRLKKVLNWMRSATNNPNFKILELKITERASSVDLLEILRREEAFEDLIMLNLVDNGIDKKGAEVLAQNRHWTQLHTLNLSNNNIGDEGAKQLSQKTVWTQLNKLDLSYNFIGNDGAKALSKNKTWSNLHTINLTWNNIGSNGATALSQNSNWKNLHTLNLSHNKIGSEGATRLSQNPNWKKLHTLDLSVNKIGDEGATRLSQNTVWTNLHTLNLSENNISDEGTTTLSKNTVWTNLHTLELSENEIGATGAAALSIFLYLPTSSVMTVLKH